MGEDKIDIVGPIDPEKIPLACVSGDESEAVYLPGSGDFLDDALHVITAEELECMRLELDAIERRN